MTIDTGDLILKFKGGTLEEVTDSAAAVADGSWSVAGDMNPAYWTSPDDTPRAVAIIKMPFVALPTAGSAIYLHARVIEMDGTNSEDEPNNNFQPHPLGLFPVNASLSEQWMNCEFRPPRCKSGQKILFYVNNKSGVELPALWQLFIEDVTTGQKA